MPLFAQDFFSTQLWDMSHDLISFRASVVRPNMFDSNLLN